MATGYVVYSEELYKDADAKLKENGVTMEEMAGDSTSLIGVGINRRDKKQNYILLAKKNGWDASADLYATGKNNLTTFCRFFWLKPSKYIVENPPKPQTAVQPLETSSAAELCAETEAQKSNNKNVSDIILAIDGAIDCRNAVSGRAVREAVKAVNEHSDLVTNDIIDAFKKWFDVHGMNFIRASEEARAAYKTLGAIAQSGIEISQTLKKIDAKLGKLETRQEEMNQRLNGLSQSEVGISANVAKMVTFVDRFTKR